MKLLNVSIVGLVLMVASVSTEAQTWKDALNKAKQKIQSQTGVKNSSSSTQGNQTTVNDRSTGSGTSEVPSPSAPADSTAAKSSSDSVTGTGRYTYCWLHSSDYRMFFSGLIPTSYTTSSQFRAVRSQLYMEPFRDYVAAQYNLPDLRLGGGGVTCQDPTQSTQGFEQDIQSIHLPWRVVRTGWKGTNTPSSQSSQGATPTMQPQRDPQAINNSATLTRSSFGSAGDLSQYETHGQKGYTYCFALEDHKTYLSKIFEANGPDAGMSTEQFRALFNKHYILPFQDYLDLKYDARGSSECVDPKPSRQAAEADKTLHDNYKSHDGYEAVQTEWAGSTTALLSPQELEPAARSALYIRRAVEREHNLLPDQCAHNVMLSANLDCDCFAEHVYQVRLQSQNTLATEVSQLHPLLSQLYPVAHLEACTSREKIETSAAKQIDRMSVSEQSKDALKACAPPKLATAVLANPSALIERPVYNSLNMQAMQSCSLPH